MPCVVLNVPLERPLSTDVTMMHGCVNANLLVAISLAVMSLFHVMFVDVLYGDSTVRYFHTLDSAQSVSFIK
jgi:hypothetical protein